MQIDTSPMLSSDDVLDMLVGNGEDTSTLGTQEQEQALGGVHINGPGRGMVRENSIQEEEEEGLMMARSPPRANAFGLGIGGVL